MNWIYVWIALFGISFVIVFVPILAVMRNKGLKNAYYISVFGMVLMWASVIALSKFIP